MTIEISSTPAVAPSAAAVTPPETAVIRATAPPLRTKNQSKASAMSDGIAVRAKWKTLVGEVHKTWGKIAPEEIARVDGNFHRLAGLVQLRTGASREESDRQVKAFFDKHYAA